MHPETCVHACAFCMNSLPLEFCGWADLPSSDLGVMGQGRLSRRRIPDGVRNPLFEEFFRKRSVYAHPSLKSYQLIEVGEQLKYGTLKYFSARLF